MGFLRHGELITTADLTTLRSQHRLTGCLPQPLPAIPDSLTNHLQLLEQTGERVTLEIKGHLLESLEWLKESHLSDIVIEPTRLRSLYEQIHPDRRELQS